MPADFPPWPRFYAFFTRWRDTGLVTELHERLRETVRAATGTRVALRPHSRLLVQQRVRPRRLRTAPQDDHSPVTRRDVPQELRENWIVETPDAVGI
jgi:transposase